MLYNKKVEFYFLTTFLNKIKVLCDDELGTSIQIHPWLSCFELGFLNYALWRYFF